MAQVYVAQGVHFNLPYLPITVHTTMAGANTAALSLVSKMLVDADLSGYLTNKGFTWERGLAKLRRMYDDADVNVWITATVLTE